MKEFEFTEDYDTYKKGEEEVDMKNDI